MVAYAKSLFKSSVFRGGSAFFIGGILLNIFNYFYRIAMGRMLSSGDFGELIAILSLLLIFAVPASPLQITVAKFSAKFKASGALGKLKGFVIKYSYIILGATAVFLGVGFLFSTSINKFLNLSSLTSFYILLAIVSVLIFSSIPRGILQGLERFNQLSAVMILEGGTKFFLAIGLVYLGFSVLGALGAIFVSVILVVLMSTFFVKDILFKKAEDNFKVDKEFLKYIGFTFLAFFFLNTLLNIDIVLVKHYFSAEETGAYAAFSTIARTIFIVGMLISSVMFPILARKKERKENPWPTLRNSIMLTTIVILFSTVILFIKPSLFMQLFFGSKYTETATYLGYYGLIMGAMALVFMLSYFFIALNKFKFVFILIFSSILEVIFIVLWHDSFMSVMHAFSLSLGVAFMGMVGLLFLTKDSLLKK